MEIVWYGHACCRLKSRDISIITDPYDSKVVGLNLGKPVADIVTVSHNHPGHANVAAVGGGPKVIAGPGEYEIRGVFITGIQSYHDSEGGKKAGRNTIYLFELDDIVVCHLGDLGHPLTSVQAEAMSNVDVLLIPIGGTGALSTAQAAEVISLIEPKVTVPLVERAEGEGATVAEPLERFCRELGAKVPVAQPKLALTRSTLPETAQVVVLEVRKA